MAACNLVLDYNSNAHKNRSFCAQDFVQTKTKFKPVRNKRDIVNAVNESYVFLHSCCV